MKLPNNILDKKACNFIGLGKLGLPLACLLAKANYLIKAFDQNEKLLSSLISGKVPFYEPGLSDLFKNVSDNFVSYNKNLDDSLLENSSTVILVNTQDAILGYSRKNVEDVILQLAEVFRRHKPRSHKIILSSTMTVGDIEYLNNLLEERSGWSRKLDFEIIYVPDFVRLGNTLFDFQNPEFVMIGSDSEDGFQFARQVWSSFLLNDPKFGHLTCSEAELGKIALNAYIVNKISFANHLGLIAEKIGNIRTNEITAIIGLDKRISPYFFRAGTPYGGTCFPRDAKAYAALGRKFEFPALHLEFSENVNMSLLKNIFEKSKLTKRVGIIGVSFKPNSPVLIESPSIKLMKLLSKNNNEVYFFDELVDLEDSELQDYYSCENIEELVEKCGTVVIMHPNLDITHLNLVGKNVINPWGN